MLRPSIRPSLVVLAVILASLTTGCARRQMSAPPLPADPPRDVQAARPAPATSPTAPSLDASVVLELSPAFFDFDSQTLRADAREALDRDARLLRDRPDATIVIEGHCDERGTIDYNLALGERRAQTAKAYLVAAGVPASRIRIVSYGSERPFATGHDELAWSQNRRAHVRTE